MKQAFVAINYTNDYSTICTKSPWNSNFFRWNRMRTSGSTTYFNLGQNLRWKSPENRERMSKKRRTPEEQKRKTRKKKGRRGCLIAPLSVSRTPIAPLSVVWTPIARCRSTACRQRLGKLCRVLSVAAAPAIGNYHTDSGLSVYRMPTGIHFSNFFETPYISRIAGEKTYI